MLGQILHAYFRFIFVGGNSTSTILSLVIIFIGSDDIVDGQTLNMIRINLRSAWDE